MGLMLNETKYEAVLSDESFIAYIRAVLPGCAAVAPERCELLGAAIGKEAVALSLARRGQGLRAITGRLASIFCHDAVALLRVSLAHPRAVYELRAGASFRDSAALENYDGAL